MCEHHSTDHVAVIVPAHLSHTGQARPAIKGIDRCIAPLVEALNAGGVATVASCCGHGANNGSIVLADGRELRIYPTVEGMQPLVRGSQATRPLIDALRSIANGQQCETYTGTFYCRTEGSGRRRDAIYGAERWCDTCIARDALDAIDQENPDA